MAETNSQFSEEIDEHQKAEISPTSTIELATEGSSLSIRDRGGFIVGCELTSMSTDIRCSVLYSDPDTLAPKLTASHIMSPVGPSNEIGGQHGFARWADYHEFTLGDGANEEEKRVAIQAKRSDNGLAIAKTFILGTSKLQTETILFNPEQTSQNTSLGEHLYFSLRDEVFTGLLVDGKSIDELLGEGTEQKVKDGVPIIWDGFPGQIEIGLPRGEKIQLSSRSNENIGKIGMIIWHRPGSPSICFEPTLGFDNSGNNGLKLDPYSSVTLATEIELM